MKSFSKILLSSSAMFFLAACTNTATEETETPQEDTAVVTSVEETEDIAEMENLETVSVTMIDSNSNDLGIAVFSEEDGEVILKLDLQGMSPGEYGMHIHEVGQATPPTFEDAGSHFNPTNVEHGTESETGPHIGDLPNLVVPENGIVQESIVIPNTSLQENGENTLNTEQGTSLIIHTEADDYESQPSGDAGARMVGGVIFPVSEE